MFFWNKDKNKDHLPKVEKISYIKEIEKIYLYHRQIEFMEQEGLIELTRQLREESTLSVEERKVQAYAIIFEVIRRTLFVTPYNVQLSGAIALREGNIAQMRTGEGKTITAILPAFWGYVDKQQTYVITVNEYLAERDYLEAQTVFDYLNINIGLIHKDMMVPEKKGNYEKPIVYITNSEFAFDYLRDNIASHESETMQKSFDFAIIDEVDLILIDEAKNPVIISGQSMDNLGSIEGAKHFVNTLVEDEDYEIDEDFHIPILIDGGFNKGKAFFGHELTENNALYNAINQAMLAKFKFKKDVDYIIRDGEVMIVDKYTGRVLPGRRFQYGLHQAIEMKENVEIQPENTTMATTTYQSLFRQFKVKSGMTGTATESKDEFKNIYGMEVKIIPTNRPVIRKDHLDILFETNKDKYSYLLNMVKEKHEKGQPILIGTTSVKESEEVSETLSKANIPFSLLNAKNDKEEVEIVKRAGERGMVTISTNMAGRGTDIKLTKEIEELGGLFVIGTSRNESKRIDRQLQGRSGRQGQMGESIFLTSIEDEFLVMNPTMRLEKFMEKNKKYPVTTPISTKMVDEIQLTIDSQHASVRKLQFQMDDLLHYQREYVYQIRREILLQGLNPENVAKKAKETIEEFLTPFLEISPDIDEWDVESFKEELLLKLGIHLPFDHSNGNQMDFTKKELVELLIEEILTSINRIQETVADDTFLYQYIGKKIALDTIDKYWVAFLNEIDMYKQGFGFTTMGEQDPIRKFSMDMDEIFKLLMKEALAEFYFHINRIQIGTKPSIVIEVQ
jgi:preprotein translocase subunit SecA